MRAPEPGVYPGVPAELYHGWEAGRTSQLKLFERSPAHARYAILHQAEATTYMNVGQALHVATLEPEKFREEFVVAPHVDRRTNVGKATWAEFQMASAGKTVLSGKEHDLAANMSAAVYRHPFAQELLQNVTHSELSLVWDDPTTGIRMKARLDILTTASGFTWIVDLKSTVDASPRGFGRQIANLHYDLQAAIYLDGANVLMPHPRRFAFIAAEKEPPYCVAVYDMGAEDLAVGYAKYRRWAGQWKACNETNTWPGYGAGLQTPWIPGWNRRDFEEEL